MFSPAFVIFQRQERDVAVTHAGERWVDVETVAAPLSVNKDSLYRWIEQRRFPVHHAGRLLRFKLSEVDKWVKQGGGNKKQRRTGVP